MFPTHLQHLIKTKTSSCDLGTIQTFQVHPVTKRGKVHKRGIDDFTYQLFPELLELVPRAYSVLRLPDGRDITLKGFPKFTGETPYDDDDVSEEYAKTVISSEPAEEINRVEFQEKANGKMGIATFFEHEGVHYIFGGSKNIHIVRRMDSEILGDQLHEKILSLIRRDVTTAGISNTELLGKTLVGEYEDGCHIIYRDEKRMVYFSCDNRLPTVGHVLPPQSTLPTPEQIREIRNLEGIEGVVIVYYGKNGNVVCRKKIKTISYVLLRAAREKLCKANNETYKAALAKLLRTFEERGSKTFLDLDKETILAWHKRIVEFAEFVATSSFCFGDLSFRSPIGMARVWHTFVTDPEGHKASLGPSAPVGPSPVLTDLLDEANIKKLEFAKKAPCPVLIVTRGPSGSGKSTLAKLISATTFCTDDEFMVNGQYLFDQKKLKQNHNLTFSKFSHFAKENADKSGIIATLANTALASWEFERYSRRMNSLGGIAVVLNMKTQDVDLLLQRSTHMKTRYRLEEQSAKFEKSVHPQYYGVIFDKSAIFVKRDLNTVPHVTLVFCGGEEKPGVATFEEKCGEEDVVAVIGISRNKAGTCLVVDGGYHITTTVNKGYKPVDVGTLISDDNTELYDTPRNLKGLIGPIY